uniref:Uncharacterized protein n=1 Tax=Musca domestica TaxID=7370 RepID=A0A1I8NK51_MUSDO
MMRVPARRNVIRKFKYCLNCLAKSHTVRDCHSKDVCRKCGYQHHTMLHPESQGNFRPNVHGRLALPSGEESPSRELVPRRTSPNPASQRNNRRPNRQHRPPQQQRPQSSHQPQRRQSRNNSQTYTRRRYRQPQSVNIRSMVMPNQRLLSQAIKSLASVLCVSTSVAQVQGRGHGQIR